MDLVTITDTLLGLTNVAVRITEIEEDDAGILAVTAEEFPGGTATAVQYPVQIGGGGIPTNQNVVPARVNTPVIFEPPAALTSGIANVSSRRPAASRRLIRWRRPARQGRTIRNRLMARR